MTETEILETALSEYELTITGWPGDYIYFDITQRGQDIYASNPCHISAPLKVLERYA